MRSEDLPGRKRNEGRRPRALPVLIALSVVVAGCQSERASGRRVESSQEQLQELLSRRSAQLERGNTNKYLRPVDKGALDVERTVALGAQQARLATIEMIIQRAFVHPRRRELDKARIDFTYLHKALPEDNLFRFRLMYGLRREGSSWRMRSAEIDDRDIEIVPPWATGPIETARSPHFLAMFRPGLTRVDEILGLAERARAKLVPKLTLPPDKVHLMVLAKDDEEFKEFTGDPDNEALAIAYRYYNPRGGFATHPENREMIVNMAKVFSLELVPHEQQELHPREVFQHELGHLALSPYDRVTTPGWVAEGGAMFLSGERRIVSWRAGLDTGIFEKMEFAEISGKSGLTAREYPYANAAVSYLTEEFPVPRFWEFYRGFTNFRPDLADNTTGTSFMRQIRADRTRRLLGIHYDIRPEELDRLTRSYMEKEIADS